MADPSPNPLRFRLGRWLVDPVLHEARAGDEVAELGANEVALLRHLRTKGAPAARREILVDVFGYAPRAKSRAVDMAVRRLRQKLEADPSQPTLLLSKAGVGLYLTSETPTSTPEPHSTNRWTELEVDAREALCHLTLLDGAVSERALALLLGPGALERLLPLQTWIEQTPQGIRLTETARALPPPEDVDWEATRSKVATWLADLAWERRFEVEEDPSPGLAEVRELFHDMLAHLTLVGPERGSRLIQGLMRYLDDVGPITSRDELIRTGLRTFPDDPSLQALGVLVGAHDEERLEAAATHDKPEVRLMALEVRVELWPKHIDAAAEQTWVRLLERPVDALYARLWLLKARGAQGEDVKEDLESLHAESSGNPVVAFWCAIALTDVLRRLPGRHTEAVTWCEWAAKEARRHTLTALELQAERRWAYLLCDISPSFGVMAQRLIIVRLADQGWTTGDCQLTVALLDCALDDWERALEGMEELRNSQVMPPGYGPLVDLLSKLCEVHLGRRPGSVLTTVPTGLTLTGLSAGESQAFVHLMAAEGAVAMESDLERKKEIASAYAVRPERAELRPTLGHLATAFLRRSGHVTPG